MPRKGNPGNIRAGAGKRTPDKGNLTINTVSTTPTVGWLGDSPEAEVTAIDGLEGGAPGLKAHVNYPKNAHPAATISIDPYPPLYLGEDVNAALDELAALIPPMPPVVGRWSKFVEVSGIPDWGVLKLNESPLDTRGGFVFWQTGNADSEIYPYYWYPPHPAQEYPPFTPEGTHGPLQDQGGGDPATDPIFNVTDIPYDGGGPGDTYAGAFTRAGTDLVKTARVMEFIAPNRPVVVSGVVFPADRGVLALLHWPPNGGWPEFLAQPLTDRCAAALLLGGGLLDGLDGLPGGIFSVGAEGGFPGYPYDPFSFPGQATGQFDLREIHTGLFSSDFPPPKGGSPLPWPYDTANPAGGQVRLGTDPEAGIVPVPNGIPILGGTTVARGGGDDNNFFRYRLPYWDDYTNAGLKYSPPEELLRWYTKPAVALDPGDPLLLAGNYPNLPKKYWAFQLARFRHRFLLQSVGVGGLVESGDYVLVHFKEEEFFERVVRDGEYPYQDWLYSPMLETWSKPSDPTNVSLVPAQIDGAAPAYHTIRGAIAEDEDAVAVPTFTSNAWDFGRVPDMVMRVSGVAYFLPLQLAVPAPSFQIVSLALSIDDLFKFSYRTHDLASDQIHNPNPLFLSLSPFSHTTEITDWIDVPGGFVTDPTQQVRRQRVEFRFEDLGPYDQFTPPISTDTATVTLVGQINFAGDLAAPVFMTDANVRAFIRRPVGHRNPLTAVFPTTGQLLAQSIPAKILFHSTRHDGVTDPTYGNFVNAGVVLPGLETVEKDVTEKFLDETYRWHSRWLGVTPVANRSNLIGPGLSGTAGVPTPITDLPVRAGSAAGAPYNGASWCVSTYYVINLTLIFPTDMSTEAQVAGIPDRNPPVTDGVTSPTPSAGLLMFPQKGYVAGYRPDSALGDITLSQPDYSVAAGDREYVRAFDTAFSRSTAPCPHSAGQPYFSIRIHGVKLENFAYAGYVPGGAKGLSIYAKVPGSTTWMDMGRIDGDGPSKQDAALDGAGCQVVGVGTYDAVDQESGVVYSQVRVNVGPTQNLFTNTAGEVPVLIKIVLHDNVNGKWFNFEQSGPDATVADCRGVIGLELVRPENA